MGIFDFGPQATEAGASAAQGAIAQAQAALLAAIAAEPACDLNRLAYADWLQESKEDGEERAAAIRRGVKKPKWWTFPEGEGAYIVANPAEPHARPITLARGYPGIQWQTYKGMIGACICTFETWIGKGGTRYALADRILVNNWIPEVVLTTPPSFTAHGTIDGTVVNIEGRDKPHEVKYGDDTAQVVLSAEWPAVRRWILPSPIQGVKWAGRDVEPDEYDGHNWGSGNPDQEIDRGSCPQVGSIVTVFPANRSAVLITPVDAVGFGCVRSEYK